MNPLERVRALRDRLLNLDSGSGEAADLSALLRLADAARHELTTHDMACNRDWKLLAEVISEIEKEMP